MPVKTLLLMVLLLLGFSANSSPLPGTGGENTTRIEQRETTSKPSGYWQQFNFWVLQKQRDFHRQLTAVLEDFSEGAAWQTAWVLLLVSFFYGVFHAAGPGHGKAVITAYLVSQPEKLKKGLLLSFTASLLQGVTAIVLVTVLVHLLGRLAREAFSSVLYVEMASFALVAFLGLALVIAASKRLYQKLAVRQAPTFQPVVVAEASGFVATPSRQTDVCPSCGKAHHMTPEEVEGKNPLQTLALLFSIGLRPCSGAVLVLVVANLMGLWWIGVSSVLVMALGTSLTVMTLAVLAVKARELAYRLLGAQSRGLAWLPIVLGLAGGLFIFFLGVTLMQGVVSNPHPLGIV